MTKGLIRQSSLGQVWTPDGVAQKMARLLLENMGDKKHLRILDPAVGPATFPKALFSVAKDQRISVLACDVDRRMTEYTKKIAPFNRNSIDCLECDYLRSEKLGIFDAIIMNPPYIRQELIKPPDKNCYYKILDNAYQTRINRRSNLFVLFLLKALADLPEGSILCAIVYEAINNCAYGKEALELMTSYSEIIYQEHIKEPFDNAIIDAQIILWRKNSKTAATVSKPISLDTNSDNVPLSAIMAVKRGTALPYRKIFLPSPEHPLRHCAKPILIKQRNPDLFTCRQFDYAFTDLDNAALCDYLSKTFIQQGLDISKIVVRPVSGDICFNYYLRDKPRHLYNEAGVNVSDNFYVGKPLHDFPSLVAWLLLNSDIYTNSLMANGRNQGNGLTKLQMSDYKTAMVPNWLRIPKEKLSFLMAKAAELLHAQVTYNTFRSQASELAKWAYR